MAGQPEGQPGAEGPTVPGPGSRLRCGECGSEAIVIKATGPDLSCCGQPMEITFTRAAGPTGGR
jgi:hypothetical protein